MTVAELIAILAKLPQDAELRVEGDYASHYCDGARLVKEKKNDIVLIEIDCSD